MRIIFLDFDGVMHPAGTESPKFSQRSLLEDFLRDQDFLDVLLVITSTWREAYSLEGLRKFFSADIQHRVLSCTATLDEYETEYERAEEIEHWLDAHEPCESWVALDDDEQGFPPRFRTNLVLTDSTAGLTENALSELRDKLGGASLDFT